MQPLLLPYWISDNHQIHAAGCGIVRITIVYSVNDGQVSRARFDGVAGNFRIIFLVFGFRLFFRDKGVLDVEEHAVNVKEIRVSRIIFFIMVIRLIDEIFLMV